MIGYNFKLVDAVGATLYDFSYAFQKETLNAGGVDAGSLERFDSLDSFVRRGDNIFTPEILVIWGHVVKSTLLELRTEINAIKTAMVSAYKVLAVSVTGAEYEFSVKPVSTIFHHHIKVEKIRQGAYAVKATLSFNTASTFINFTPPPVGIYLPDAKVSQRLTFFTEEKRLFAGPPIEGVSGDVQHLNSAQWGLIGTQAALLKLYTYSDAQSLWIETAPISAVPNFFNSACNITAQFDQAARLILAGEGAPGSPEQNQIFVNQYDAQSISYVLRGPFSGHTPVLFNDGLLASLSDSDLVLFYMSLDRLTVHYRLQRDNFGVEYTYIAFSNTGVTYYLDQASLVSASVQLALWVSDDTKVYITSDAYPRNVNDATSLSTEMADANWDLILIEHQAENDSSTLVSQFADGEWFSTLVERSAISSPSLLSVMSDGELFEILKTYDSSDKSALETVMSDGEFVQALIPIISINSTPLTTVISDGEWFAV